MRKNKYLSDFRGYIYANVKSNVEQSPLISKIHLVKSIVDTMPVSLDIWDKKFRANSTERYGCAIREHLHNSNNRVSARNKPENLLEFSYSLGLPIQLLIKQFSDAGIPNLSPDATISDHHKTALLEHLRKMHDASNISKITLTRTLTGKIEVRKKRVLLYEDEPPPIKTQVVLEDVNDELMFYLARKPEFIYELHPRKFEEMIAKLFADRGHEVTLTKKTRDGGYDIFARVKDAFSEFIVLAECKRYSPENKVGVEVVRGLYGVVDINKANQGLIITSSFFTKDAQQEQLRIGNRIGLKDYNNLIEWLKPYSNINE
jgi:restriction system protein